MSDNYRDGSPGKRWTLSWWLVRLVYVTVWLSDLGRKDRR